MTVHYRTPLRPERARLPLLVPACDRCGIYCRPVFLRHDGLGPVCPSCFRDGAA